MPKQYTEAEKERIRQSFRDGLSWTEVKRKHKVRGQSTLQRLRDEALAKSGSRKKVVKKVQRGKKRGAKKSGAKKSSAKKSSTKRKATPSRRRRNSQAPATRYPASESVSLCDAATYLIDCVIEADRVSDTDAEILRSARGLLKAWSRSP